MKWVASAGHAVDAAMRHNARRTSPKVVGATENAGQGVGERPTASLAMTVLGSYGARETVRNAVQPRRVSRNCIANVRVRSGNFVVPERNEHAAVSLLSLSSNGAADVGKRPGTAKPVPVAD